MRWVFTVTYAGLRKTQSFCLSSSECWGHTHELLWQQAVVWQSFFLGRCNSHVYSPQEWPKYGYHWSSTWVNQWVLLGLLTGVWLRGYYSQGQKWLRESSITKAHPNVGDCSQKLGTWNILHRKQAGQQIESVLFKWLNLVLRVFFIAFSHLSSDSQLLLFPLTERSLVNLVHFRDFLKLFEFTLLLKELPAEWNLWISEETITQQRLNIYSWSWLLIGPIKSQVHWFSPRAPGKAF